MNTAGSNLNSGYRNTPPVYRLLSSVCNTLFWTTRVSTIPGKKAEYLACLLSLFICHGASVIAEAGEKPVVLHFANYSSPRDPVVPVAQIFKQELEELTDGQVSVQFSHGSALGRPMSYYDLAADGATDIAYTFPAYNPGRFPLLEVIMLPIYYPDNMVAARALLKMWQQGHFDAELADVKVLWMWTGGPTMFYWTDQQVASLADFHDKKIRTGGGLAVPVIERLGAIPVRLEFSELYQAMQLGTVDGTHQGWAAGAIAKLYEVSTHATDVGIMAAAFIAVMNKDTWDRLPPEARDYIDNNRARFSLMISQSHHDMNELARKLFLQAGGEISELGPEGRKQMNALLQPMFQKWVNDVEEAGLPGEQTLDDLYQILLDAGVEEPFSKGSRR